MVRNTRSFAHATVTTVMVLAIMITLTILTLLLTLTYDKLKESSKSNSGFLWQSLDSYSRINLSRLTT